MGFRETGGGCRVFVNPPYGREIKDWIKKCYEESLKFNTTVVCLIPARTDTSYWHDYIFGKAYDIRFLRGRIKFEDINGEAKNSAPFPSAVVVFDELTKKTASDYHQKLCDSGWSLSV